MVQGEYEFSHLSVFSLWKNPQGKDGRDNQVDRHTGAGGRCGLLTNPFPILLPNQTDFMQVLGPFVMKQGCLWEIDPFSNSSHPDFSKPNSVWHHGQLLSPLVMNMDWIWPIKKDRRGWVDLSF